MSSVTLKQIASLAESLVAAGRVVVEAEATLKRAKAEMKQIEEEDLPELMREVGLTLVQLEDGSKIQVSDEISCGITEANKAAAHEWLVENGFGGIIKTEAKVTFDKGEHDAAVAASEAIENLLQRPVLLGESVHASTLKSFLKEQMAAGTPLPYELFGIRPFARAKLTPAK
jgi:hypothetical protein